MCKVLAETLGWLPPSERFAKTAERAQKCAYNTGAQEISAGHLFSAVLEDLDAVYFLARHEIPLERLEALKQPEKQVDPSVPRLPAPAYYHSKPVTLPHLDITASAAVRRIAGLACALAERRSLSEVHGGLVLEAILEDGRSEAAKALKALHAEIAREKGGRLTSLPGAGYGGALIAVQAPPQKEAPKPQPMPRQPGLTSREQVRMLLDEIECSLQQDQCYRLVKELEGYPLANWAALQLRGEAQASLDANPAYIARSELLRAERAVEEADARVRSAAIGVGEVRPDIFQKLLSRVPDATAAQLRAGLEARKLERAAMEARALEAAAGEHWPLQADTGTAQADARAAGFSVVTAAWGNFAVPAQIPPQAAANEEGTKKSSALFGRLRGSVAAARATMWSFFG